MFNIVPQPNEIIITGGKTGFTLTPDTTMTKVPYIDEFRDFVKKQFDIRIHRDNENTENAILLKTTNEVENDESYRLVCRDGSIYIYGRTDAGIFYGLQTLKQLLLQGMGQIPDMFIEDKPRYPYRGFMLDTGRYCRSVKEIKRLIDLISLHKLNAFHWRIPEESAKHGRKKSEATGYTQEEIQEVTEYCHRRFVKVIMDAKDNPHNGEIVSPAFPYHLDCPYGWANLKQVYEYEPPTDENIYGVEALLWSEYVPNLKRTEYCIFPRLGAVAEGAWSLPEDRSYERFSAGLPEYFDLLNTYHVHYATMKQAMPAFLLRKAQVLWFQMRGGERNLPKS